MKVYNCDMRTFSQRCQGKKIACYGIGGEFQKIMDNYVGYEWQDNISYLVDGNQNREGDCLQLNNKKFTIMSLDNFKRYVSDDVVIFITCQAYAEIVGILNGMTEFDTTECYLFHFMFSLPEYDELKIRQTDDMLIPPVIHYCWFGGKELPDMYKQCIDSWYKYCPNYEIKEWNETNCDVYETDFTKAAYENKKYGFVPDFFRLKIIYENGGIYLDTDVEILKNLDDLRYNRAFCGMQYPGLAALGLGFGAVKGLKIIEHLMRRYYRMEFPKESAKQMEIASPNLQTEDFLKLGMVHGNQLQIVEDMTIYPIEVLSPKNVNTHIMTGSKYSYCVHHFDGSWVDAKQRNNIDIRVDNAKKIANMIQGKRS